MATEKMPLNLLTDVTKTVHRVPYPAISPTRPELTQAGKIILVTGGHTGVGKAIAKAFIQASAATVIIVGRRTELVAQGVDDLKQEAEKVGTNTKILSHMLDITNLADVDAFWANLKDKGIFVDVLVSNAARFAKPGKLLEHGTDELWSMYEANVKAPLRLTENFYKQEGDKQRYLINISTQAVHMWELPDSQNLMTYGVTKNSGTLLYQVIADETLAEKMQIISVHPGTIFTEVWQNYGVDKTYLPFDEEDLPGQWAVWASSPEARFLHGRFVWASWDVEELKSGPLRKRLDEDYHFLRIGVSGLHGSNLV